MRKNAFTLLELLVVIGIIGILVALATVSYSATQQAGRDAKRKQDLVAIQNALEQYYSDPANAFSYPDGSCKVASSHLENAWPVDPKDNSDYSGVSACTTTSYCICVLMERAGSGNSSNGSCSYSTATKTYYCVGNLQ